MFGFNKPNEQLEAQLAQTKSLNAELKGLADSLSRSTAVIEFKPDGTILTANDNFLAAVGYSLNEIVGQHHKIFCDSFYSSTQEYRDFWKTLNNGDFLAGQYERVTKNGDKIWLEASYNPVFDENERLVKIVKFASDISERIETSQEQQSLIDAMKRSSAVIEFRTNGEIITANDNFLAATGYRLEEITGKHHRIFCEDSLANSAEYKQFWNTLNEGQYVSGQFKRVDKHGNVLWLEASYNPIFNSRGELVKIVKFATDVTNRIQASQEARDVAYNTSLQADKSAQEGSSVVNQAIDIMTSLSGDITQASENLDALNKQSDQINNIVNTISSIAEQTNLLALNAAIEAARAGEQGRGFAVVADEVRGLAARTSSSTTEIAEVVKQNVNLSQLATTAMQASIEQVNSGVHLVEQLSGSISEINAGVGQIVEEMDRLNQSEK